MGKRMPPLCKVRVTTKLKSFQITPENICVKHEHKQGCWKTASNFDKIGGFILADLVDPKYT